MRRVSVQIFLAVVVTPVNLSMEGTLLVSVVRELVQVSSLIIANSASWSKSLEILSSEGQMLDASVGHLVTRSVALT